MKLETFITNFMTDGSKDKYVKSVVNGDYVPYVDKCNDCDRILRSCHYKDVDGVRRFVMNSPAQAMMFVLVLVDRYTKIDVEFSADTYDQLQKCGALGLIISSIPEGERQEYSAVLSMAEDDLVMTETNVGLRLDDIKQAVASFANSYMSAIAAAVETEENNGDVLEGATEGAGRS